MSGSTLDTITAANTLAGTEPLYTIQGGADRRASVNGVAGPTTGALSLVPLGVAGGGSDESSAFMTAHDAAVTAGYRMAMLPYVSGGYSAPTAYGMGNVIFTGPQRANIAPHKWVQPLGTQGPKFPDLDLVPAVHLRRVARVASPRVVIVGDSTTIGTDITTITNIIGAQVETRIRLQNPGRSFTYTNRGIGGTTYADLANVSTAPAVTLPNWYTNTSQPWIYYVRDLTPDLVIVNLGTNGPVAGTTTANLEAIWNEIASWTPRPDVVFMTNFVRGSQTDTTTMESALNQRLQSAAFTRNYALYKGAGLIDIGRMSVQFRDGYDPRWPALKRVANGIAENMGYTFPTTFTTTDFSVQFTANNTSSAFWQNGAVMRVTLSPFIGANTQYIEVYQSGGTFRVRAFSGATTILADTNTGVTVPTSSHIIQIEAVGPRVVFEANGTRLIDIPNFPRGNGPWRPAITWQSGGTNNTMGPLSVWIADPAPAMPQMTNTEMFGGTGNDYQGNGLNHPCNLSLAHLVSRTLDNCNFCLDEAGVPIEQSITAAGAIDVRAGLVRLTGPTSGTYAVTLAAPDPVTSPDQMVIQMTGTTSTNSVTLALTNIRGGSATSTATFDAANETLILTRGSGSWFVSREIGVTLS